MFGGRGGGRGRGRGGAMVVARDEDGAPITPVIPTGPPPLYPLTVTIDPAKDIEPLDERLLTRSRNLSSVWKGSPFYLELPKPKAHGVEAEIERYSDKYTKQAVKMRPPINTVMQLNAKSFPSELYTNKDLKASRRSARTGMSDWQSGAGQPTGDLQRLEHLATLERKYEEDGDDDEEGPTKKKVKTAEGEDEEENDDEEEEEEEVDGDDDYNQGFGYDDDDGYEDDLGGGDDDEAVY